MSIPRWVVCSGVGRMVEEGVIAKYTSHFLVNSVGYIKQINTDGALVFIVGDGCIWNVKNSDFSDVDVFATGDKYHHKICNRCHCLLPIDDFAPNQNNKHGMIRRPSCKQCRTDIDKRAAKSAQAKQAEKNRPKTGTAFHCPICRKRSIVGITAKIVADHNHHTGDIRDFICDSCNTGLGRFMNGKNLLHNALHYLEERKQ